MTPDLLAGAVREFLVSSPSGAVIEEGEVLFELGSSRYSISAERGRCLLHIWSAERNVVREIVDLASKKNLLQLSARRFGQTKPHKLLICHDRDQRTPAARKAARHLYARALEKSLLREFPGAGVSRLLTSMDLRRSFSPVYARGMVRQGNSAIAVLGVSREETQPAIDAALTFGLLWLEECRRRAPVGLTVAGLRLYVPPSRSAALRLRMAHLNHERARFELCEFDETTEEARDLPPGLQIDIDSHLPARADAEPGNMLFAGSIRKVRALVPEAEAAMLAPGEISFRLHGLEFARARMAACPGPDLASQDILFGLSGFETLLTPETEEAFSRLAMEVSAGRRPQGNRRNRLWRIFPERWLESLVVRNAAAIDAQLDGSHVYSQVPAFSASARSLIDVLTCTRKGRLAVIELKADEDIHLPLQGLDYWARVRRHQERGDFPKNGYFRDAPLSPEPPLLFLVAPSLRIHPAVETILGYLSPEIEWRLAGIDERWRDRVKVVFRKSSTAANP